MTDARATQVLANVARADLPKPYVTQVAVAVAYGPPASKIARDTQTLALTARTAGDHNVAANVTQIATLVAYATQPPALARQTAWTFVMDGHRFYVLPLGEEGDWAYDTTTKEWCQLQTAGFNGINFNHGVMWGMRVMGGDSLTSYLYELDPNQPLDEEWREIEHIVTGGIATRGRSAVGVANFSIVASVDDVTSSTGAISLAFSDDQGVTWSPELEIALTGQSTQTLIWNALGSFKSPGRVFRITDNAGPIRLDGADVVLTVGSGADSGQEQEGAKTV